MAFDGEYVFGATLTDELKGEIAKRTQAHLSELLGVDVDSVMTDYVNLMIGSKRSMAQIAHDLIDFIGDDHAQQFAAWLCTELQALDAAPEDDAEALAPPASQSAETTTTTASEPPKRIVSLKSVTAPPKKVVSLASSSSSNSSGSSGTVRSLNRSGGADMDDVLARRSQRFGIPEKPAASSSNKSAKEPTKDKESGSNKRKAESNDKARPGSGRLAQLLGPPVNVDQAELDARDSLQSNKRKKTGRGDDRRSDRRSDQENQRDADGNDRRSNRRRQENDDKDGAQPPLPPGSPSDRDRPAGRSERGGRGDRDARDGRGDPRGFNQGGFRGPPGFGGYPPGPYGHPMGYYPPPYGMPPYGMGFPPHGMPPGPYMQPPMPPGPPKQHYQPRGAPRPFQNKKWVNPNTVKPEGEAPADGANAEDASNGGAPSGGAAAIPAPQPYVPRNPYYNTQMRPRFQNKTWVRQDPAKEEELNSSLPKTPPREEMEATEQ